MTDEYGTSIVVLWTSRCRHGNYAWVYTIDGELLTTSGRLTFLMEQTALSDGLAHARACIDAARQAMAKLK